MKLMLQILAEIRAAAVEAPRIYFAPLIGVFVGVRAEYARLSRKRSD